MTAPGPALRGDRTGPPPAEGRSLRYLPALDGIRGVLLWPVLAYHHGVGWVKGGFLAMPAFFVLSGFLITALLLLERRRTGTVDLPAFWGRRVRRLAPAAVVAVVLIAVTVAVGYETRPGGFVGDLIGSLTWTANWRFVVEGQDYTDLFGDPSPFLHFWSLAVEEQFYLLLPVVVAGALALRRGARWPLTVTVTGLLVASVVATRVLHTGGGTTPRIYYGTDTRGAELLVGVLLALVVVRGDQLRLPAGRAGWVLDAAAVVAVVLIGAAWLDVSMDTSWLWEGGMAGVAALSAVVVAAAARPGSVVAAAFRFRPFVTLGRISYGVYLFHWPLFLVIDERTGLEGWPLFVLRTSVSVALAWLSYRFIEMPIRTNGLPVRFNLAGWANATVGGAALAVALAATVTPAPTITLRSTGELAAPEPPPPPPRVSSTTTTTATTEPVATTGTTVVGATPVTAGSATTVPPTTTTAPPTTTTAPPALRVMVVGDSVASGLAIGLADWAGPAGVVVDDATAPGCPIVPAVQLRRGDGSTFDFPASCRQVIRDFPARVRAFRPDVVVFQDGTGELVEITTDTDPNFRAIGDPAVESHMVNEMRQRVAEARATGARVLWTNAPCFDASRHYAKLSQSVADTRRNRYNQLVSGLLASSVPITVADINGRLCPGGRFTSTVEGMPNGRPDGVHLADAASVRLAHDWLGPLVLQLAGR